MQNLDKIEWKISEISNKKQDFERQIKDILDSDIEEFSQETLDLLDNLESEVSEMEKDLDDLLKEKSSIIYEYYINDDYKERLNNLIR